MIRKKVARRGGGSGGGSGDLDAVRFAIIEHNLKWQTTTRPVGRQLITDRSSGGSGVAGTQPTSDTAIIVDDVDDADESERARLDHTDDDDDDDDADTALGDARGHHVDDGSSISSESSGDGDGIPTVATTTTGGGRSSAGAANHRPDGGLDDTEWLAGDECELIVKQLPDSALVQAALTAGDFSLFEHDEAHINTALLIAILTGRPDLTAQLMRDHRADANAFDAAGRTALHLACLTGAAGTAQLLLAAGADPNRWDKQRVCTALHCAARAPSVDCVQLLLRHGAHVNAGIERRSALHVAVEAGAVRCVEALLRAKANPNTPQVYTETPLHVAAAQGDAATMELLLRHGADVRSQCGRARTTALHLAAENDYTACVRLLLAGGAAADARNAAQQTPLHLACLAQCADAVEALLAHGADVRAIYKDGRTALHAAIVKESKCFECARLVLLAGVDVNRPDHYGYTPLHIAALNEFAACTRMLLEFGADVTARTNGGVSALAFIVRRTPEVLPKLLAKMDASVAVNEHEIGDVDCEVRLDFRVLVPGAPAEGRGETDLLLAFVEVGKKALLKHPLCETFLHLKWRRIRKFFAFSLVYHAVYVLLFTVYVLAVYGRNCGRRWPAAVAGAADADADDGGDDDDDDGGLCVVPVYAQPVGYAAIAMNCVMLAKEFFQMAHGLGGYVRYWENWVQWTIVLGVFLCTTPSSMAPPADIGAIPVWQHHVAGIVIFLVWLELMMLIGRFPVFGIYVQMFTKVAANFAKFLMAYSCLLVAFSLSFGVLFTNYPPFRVSWTMLKTIAMMAGELEMEDIFYGDTKILYPVTAHAMFLAFVLLVTVILTNLLVGLAVSDIQGLQASAGLDRLSRQAELVARLESLFFSRLLRHAPQRLIRLCQRAALLRTSRSRLQFCIRPNDPRDQRLPKDIVLEIYRLVTERRNRNQSLKRRRREHNLSYLSRATGSSGGGAYGSGAGEPVTLRRPQRASYAVGPRVCSDTLTVAAAAAQRRPAAAAAGGGAPTPVAGGDSDRQLEALRMQLLAIGGRMAELQQTVTRRMDRWDATVGELRAMAATAAAAPAAVAPATTRAHSDV